MLVPLYTKEDVCVRTNGTGQNAFELGNAEAKGFAWLGRWVSCFPLAACSLAERCTDNSEDVAKELGLPDPANKRSLVQHACVKKLGYNGGGIARCASAFEQVRLQLRGVGKPVQFRLAAAEVAQIDQHFVPKK